MKLKTYLDSTVLIFIERDSIDHEKTSNNHITVNSKDRREKLTTTVADQHTSTSTLQMKLKSQIFRHLVTETTI